MNRDQATSAIVFFLALFGVPVFIVAALLGWEAKTLLDDIPDNHITAALRAALKAEPWAVIGLLMFWVACIAAPMALVVGHVFP